MACHTSRGSRLPFFRGSTSFEVSRRGRLFDVATAGGRVHGRPLSRPFIVRIRCRRDLFRAGWRANALPALRDRSAFHRRVPRARRARLDRAFGPPPIPPLREKVRLPTRVHPSLEGPGRPRSCPYSGPSESGHAPPVDFCRMSMSSKHDRKAHKNSSTARASSHTAAMTHRLATTISWTSQPRR